MSSGELWRNRIHRVVINLCSPLLCQTSWLQRQLLKDGIILITIFVGIVSVQHQVLTISLSHGIVTMAELVYRMLVTLLYVSKQWGRSTAATLNFSLSFQKFYCITTAQESWSSAAFENTSWITRTNSSMIWPTYRGTNINYIAVGM